MWKSISESGATSTPSSRCRVVNLISTPVEAVRRQAGLGVAGVLRRLRELDHVLGVGLRVVVGHEDGGVPDVVDRAVVQHVAGHVADRGREPVLFALGPLADVDAPQKRRLGVGAPISLSNGAQDAGGNSKPERVSNFTGVMSFEN